MRVGIITSSPEILKTYFPTKEEPFFVPTEAPFTPDDQILVEHLRKQYKMDVKPIIWGTPIESLKSFDILLIRSPWDYMDTPESSNKFFEWIKELDKLNVKVFNNYDVLNWLLDKHYLKDFENVGIRTVPTRYIEKGESINLTEIYNQKGAFVIKPCISASGRGLHFIETIEDAKKQQNEIQKDLKDIGFMVQDYIEEIKTNGEWSLIFFAEEYSHSVLKNTSKTSILVQAEQGGHLTFKEPEQNIIEFAQNTVSMVKDAFKKAKNNDLTQDLLYLRVDVIEGKSGCYLSELEGVEPELFFRAKASSEDVFAKKLIQKARN